MRNYRCKSILVILIFITAFSVSSFGQYIILDNKAKSTNLALKDTLDSDQDYKVTFIELGSVRCIPCRKMQPIMKSIEAIPTQVFLDAKGKEYYRHIGFFSEGELVRVLKMQGVKQN